MQEKNLIDAQEKFWAIPNETVIWEGHPNIRLDIVRIILGLFVVVSFVSIIMFFPTQNNTAFIELSIIFIAFSSLTFPVLYFVYDFFNIKNKQHYVLLSNVLIIKAGNRLTTKHFKLADIERIELKNRKIIILLKNKVWQSFLMLFIRKTKKIKIGPFENASNIYDILNQHFLDYKNK